MPDNVLSVGTAVDIGPLSTGMATAASVTQTNITKMVASTLQIKAATKELDDIYKQYGSDVVTASALAEASIKKQVQAQLDLVAARAAVKDSLAAERNATQAVTAAEVEMGDAGEEAGQKIAYNLNAARSAAMGLRGELGLSGPGGRALSSFISQSQTLGPIFAAAFSTVALIAFVDIAIRAGEKIIDITNNLAGYTEEVRKNYDSLVQWNNQQLLNFKTAEGGQKTIELIDSEIEANEKLKQGLEDQRGGWNNIRASLPIIGIYDLWKNYTGLNSAIAQGIDLQNQHNAALDKAHALAEQAKKDAEQRAKDDARLAEQAAREQERTNDEIMRAIAERNTRISNANRERANKEKEIDKETAHALEESIGEVGKIQIEQYNKQNEAASKAFQRHLQDLRAEYEAERSLAQDNLRDKTALLDFEVSMGKISTQQKLADLRQALIAEDQAVQDALTKKLHSYAIDSAAYANTIREMEKLHADFIQKELQLDRQAAQERMKLYQTLFQSVTSAAHSSISGIIQGTQTLSQAMKKSAQDIFLGFADTFINMGLKWIETHVLMRAVSTIFHIQEQADADEAALQKVASDAAANIAQVTSASAVAFANAYAAFAYLPPLALAMGAEAQATVLSELPVASAAGGMLVDRDQLAMVHEEERVLPARYSQGLDALVGSAAQAGGAGGGINVQFSVSSMDSRSFEQNLSRYASALVNVLKREARRGSFSFAR